MRLWIVPALAASLWLLSLIRVGADVTYNAAGLSVRARLGLLRLRVFPLKERDKPPKKKKPPRKKKSEQKKRTAIGGDLALLRSFLPLTAEAAGRVRKKIRIDEIDLRLIWASPDPAAAALGYGRANAALGMIWPLIEHNFYVRRRSIDIGVDLQASRPTVYIYASISFTIGQGVYLGTILGFKALKILRARKREQKIKEAV